MIKTEAETRRHILSIARAAGYEAPILDIFRRVDEAIKNAKNEIEKEMIIMQGLSELDVYFGADNSNLNNLGINNISQSTIDKFNKR